MAKGLVRHSIHGNVEGYLVYLRFLDFRRIEIFRPGPDNESPRGPEKQLTWTQDQILYVSFPVPWNRSPGLFFVDVCSVFQAGAAGNVSGPNYGRKPAKKL